MKRLFLEVPNVTRASFFSPTVLLERVHSSFQLIGSGHLQPYIRFYRLHSCNLCESEEIRRVEFCHRKFIATIDFGFTILASLHCICRNKATLPKGKIH